MQEEEREEALAGGNVNAGVVRIGDTVRRAMGPHSPSVHRLLKHLEAKGFSGAPRFLGIDAQGREILSYLPGETGITPDIWQGDGPLTASARLLRAYHDAVADFPRSDEDFWDYMDPDGVRHEVICHNDFAPYNWIRRNGEPYAVIDFDAASPGPRLRDIAYAAYWITPLSFGGGPMGDVGRADVAQGSHRLRLFCTTYGEPASPPLLEMVAQVLRDLRDWLRFGVESQDPIRLHMAEQGHLAHWERELKGLAANRELLERNLISPALQEPSAGGF